MRNSREYKRLLLDNYNRPHDRYATIAEDGVSIYEFDEVHVTRQASVHIAEEQTDVTLDIRKLVGDRSGLIHVHDGQVRISFLCFTFSVT